MSAKQSGEPWWVVVFDMGRDDYASITLDAPNRNEAEVGATRQLAGLTDQEPRRVARITGPFPLPVTTEDREQRPTNCHGCGLVRFCGNHPPTPKQTWFEEVDSRDYAEGHADIPWECINCRTVTWLSPDWQAVKP